MTIYAILGTKGEYSDRHVWVRRQVFLTQKEAENECFRLKSEYQKTAMKNEDPYTDEAETAFGIVDPELAKGWGTDEPLWYVQELELEAADA